jgi:hypothetical protein
MGEFVTPHRNIPEPRKKTPDSPFPDAENNLPNGKNDGVAIRPDEVTNYTILSQGVDALDPGIGVQWGIGKLCWEELRQELESGKEASVGKGEILWKEINGESVYVCPSGKAPMYRYHLQTEWGQVYIGKSPVPRKDPNVYVS